MARPTRVLMMVDNKVAGDSRVLKTAQTVSDLGYRVTVLGRRTAARTPIEADFGVRLASVPRSIAEDEQVFVTGSRWAYRSSREQEAGAQAGGPAKWWHGLRSSRRDAAVRETLETTQNLLDTARSRPATDMLADDAYWRSLQPILTSFETAYSPVIDKIRPDVIHAHDYRMLGIAVRSARRLNAARPKRRPTTVIYDAHEFVPGIEGTPEVVLGNSWYEASHIRLADRIVTVSEPLADLLLDHHGLDRRPDVTLNAPEAEARQIDPAFTQDVRSDCGLGPDVPLLVYSGGVAPRRGLDVVIRGLAQLPGVHLAVIANRDPEGRELIATTAAESGVTDRVHVLDFVPRERIVQHLRTADIAVHPMIHLPNHEIALPNKFFDYVFAGLPMIVSDVRHLSDVVTSQGLGASFPARDPEAFAAATREVLGNLPDYRRAVQDCPDLSSWTWESQEPILAAVYDELVGPAAAE